MRWRLIRQRAMKILEAEELCTIENLVSRVEVECSDIGPVILGLTSSPFVVRVGDVLYNARETIERSLPLLPDDGFAPIDLLHLAPIRSLAERIARTSDCSKSVLATTFADCLKATGSITSLDGATYYRKDVLASLPGKILEEFEGFKCFSDEQLETSTRFGSLSTNSALGELVRQNKLLIEVRVI